MAWAQQALCKAPHRLQRRDRHGQIDPDLRELAESLVGRPVYVATCPVTDDEMRERIARHQQQRRHHDWRTVEEPIDLADAILHAGTAAVVLVDSLTLWVNNVMYEVDKRGGRIKEHDIERLCRQLLAACRRHDGTVIFVTNEVGAGIVPDNAIRATYLGPFSTLAMPQVASSSTPS